MTDIFAAALSETSVLSDESQSLPSTAPSQDTLLDPSTSLDDDLIMIEDDAINPGSITLQVSLDESQSLPSSAPSQDSLSQNDQPPPAKRRKYITEKPPQFHEVPTTGNNAVMCVFVPRDNKCSYPVPLWNQYNVTWNGQNLGTSKWIVVSSQERWLMKVIDEVTQKSVRHVAKAFMDRFRNEFLACLGKARARVVLDDAFDVAHDEIKSTTVPSNVNRVQDRHAVRDRHSLPEVVVHVGGFDLVCLNHGNRIALKLCDDTVKFIAAWVVPLLRELAHSQDSQQLGATTDTDKHRPSTLQGFHFCASSTPNLRDKIVWNPLRHSWEVRLKHAKGKLTEKFVVDPSLAAHLYEAQKLAMYVAAIAAWNRLDGSSRHRIHALS